MEQNLEGENALSRHLLIYQALSRAMQQGLRQNVGLMRGLVVLGSLRVGWHMKLFCSTIKRRICSELF